MATEVYLGNPPANIVEWIKAHVGPVEHEETRYKYVGDTEWKTTMLSGTIAPMYQGSPTGQIEDPTNIIAIDIGTGPQENLITCIGYTGFATCTNLSSVIIPNCIVEIEEYAFHDTSLTSIIIPNSVTHIYDSAFSQCSNLTDITIGNGITYINNNVFSDCANLTSVIFQGKTLEQVQNIEDNYGEKQYPWGISDLNIITVA